MMCARIPFLLASFLVAIRVQAVDYVEDVLPIMQEHCWRCHSNENQVKGNLLKMVAFVAGRRSSIHLTAALATTPNI
ncbi:MAG: hypothetical protein CMO47_10430 [Verrucomicrobiales bacterium]|nr:hypothetical protein [Verrucomicrobiales bacterium]